MYRAIGSEHLVLLSFLPKYRDDRHSSHWVRHPHTSSFLVFFLLLRQVVIQAGHVSWAGLNSSYPPAFRVLSHRCKSLGLIASFDLKKKEGGGAIGFASPFTFYLKIKTAVTQLLRKT